MENKEPQSGFDNNILSSVHMCFQKTKLSIDFTHEVPIYAIQFIPLHLVIKIL